MLKIKKEYIGRSVEIKGVAFIITPSISEHKLKLLQNIKHPCLYVDNGERNSDEGPKKKFERANAKKS